MSFSPRNKSDTFLNAPSSSRQRHPLNVEDSPGSSVFDLPVYQATETPTLEKRPHPFLEIDGQPLSSANSDDNETEKHSSHPRPEQSSYSYLVISGGSGGNAICSAFADACYVLPVSDDGGSSSEIIRVLGGPSIGDIRSRLVRLIPPSPSGSPLERIANLLGHRLDPKQEEHEARADWHDIVEGRSGLWTGIPADRKEVIRGFLVYFENELLRRAQKNFCFRNGSIGNYFLAAALLFFRSLPSAIFLFSSITNSQASILPVLVTNHTVTIAAELENNRTLVGQCNISHPIQPVTGAFSVTPSSLLDDLDDVDSHIDLQRTRSGNLNYSKNAEEEVPLESRIRRLFYINMYGHEIQPSPNPDFLSQCAAKDILVYSCGSLWTSIMPCLALKRVADAIARSQTLKAKVLLLNSKNDRETSGYDAVDYIVSIASTLNTHYRSMNTYTSYPISAFITHLVYLRGGEVDVDVEKITALGVRCIEARPTVCTPGKCPKFDTQCVREAMHTIARSLHAEV